MPNQVGENRKRCSIMLNTSDFDTLRKAAKKMGMTPSVLFKEAAFRVAEELRKTKKVTITQVPRSEKADPFARPYVCIIDRDDSETLAAMAKQFGAPASFLLREGVNRVVNEIKKTGGVRFRRTPEDFEG